MEVEFDNIDEIDYSNIPLEAIGKNILEIGVSKRIINTHLWPKIREGTYTGIDVVNRVKDTEILNVIEHDIQTYDFGDAMFDTIISVHTFEHINLWNWPALFQKLKDILVIGGKMIIVLPHNQPFRGYPNFPDILTVHDSYGQHLVFGITERMLEYFLPNAQFYKKHRFIFRQDGCSLIWAIGRLIKRLLIGKFVGDFSPIRRNIYAIWEKRETEISYQ